MGGGSWFSTQFAFSKKYYEGVTGSGSSAGVSLNTWYESYLGAAVGGMGAAMSSSSNDGTWEYTIDAMYAGYDKSSTVGVPAINKERNGQTATDLLFCTTFMGDGLLSDNKTISQLSYSGVKAPFSVPAYWHIPADGSTPKWNVPDVNPSAPTELSAATWTSSATGATAGASTILPTPTVAKIGSMSSAANGATGNPELMEAYEPCSYLGCASFYDTFGSYQNPNYGVCTIPGNTCEFPAAMTMDGCYSDNLGFALNVGHMQRKYPGKKLRLMGITSGECDRTTDPTCLSSANESSFRSFFKDGPYPTTEGYFPALLPGPDRHIFAESFTTMQALGQETGYAGMSFMTGTFTTVQNDHFGVAAGTDVAIMILNVNGPFYLSPETAAETEGLSSLGVAAYNSVSQILNTYVTNGKVTSDSAFLYYQAV